MSRYKLIQGAVSLMPLRTEIGGISHKGDVIPCLIHRFEGNQQTFDDLDVLWLNVSELIDIMSDAQGDVTL